MAVMVMEVHAGVRQAGEGGHLAVSGAVVKEARMAVAVTATVVLQVMAAAAVRGMEKPGAGVASAVPQEVPREEAATGMVAAVTAAVAWGAKAEAETVEAVSTEVSTARETVAVGKGAMAVGVKEVVAAEVASRGVA
mmetsp:Transcript_31404/g.92455  ORF Transcript_31404/g.92455 Transcript_31404/m.92455 type:complete len:137 (+) Transcript_31404:1525-1935(+)